MLPSTMMAGFTIGPKSMEPRTEWTEISETLSQNKFFFSFFSIG
jgi:hypothetical protein